MRTVDSIFIFLFMAAGITVTSGSTSLIVLLLISFAVSMIIKYADKKTFTFFTSMAFATLCIAEPKACVGLPLFICNFDTKKTYSVPALCTLSLCCSLRTLPFKLTFFIAMVCFASLLLRNYNKTVRKLEERLKTTRDSSAEINMLLSEKNRNLIKLRDYEIYTATLKERNRIAREIHDTVGHMLTSSLLQVGALSVITKDETQKAAIERVKSTLNEAMTGMRKSVHDLHDDSIDLENAVTELAKTLPENFDLNFEYDMENDAPPQLKLAFLGIVKEAFNNTAKYSSGDKVQVSIRSFPGFYRLYIADNGDCSPLEPCSNVTSEQGIGLENMRERVRSLGGNVTISRSHEGFFITVNIRR